MRKIVAITLCFVALAAHSQIFTASDNCFSVQVTDTVTQKKYTYPKTQLQVQLLGSQLQLQRVNPSPAIVASWTASNVGVLAPTLADGYNMLSGWLVNTCTLVSGGSDSVQYLTLNGDTLGITRGNSVILPANGGGGYWDTVFINGNRIMYSTMLSPLDPDTSTPRIMALSGIGVIDTSDGLPAFLFQAKNGVSFHVEGGVGAEGFIVNSKIDSTSAIRLQGEALSKTEAAVSINGFNTSGADIELNAINGTLKLTNVPIQEPSYVLGYNPLDYIVTRSEFVPPALIKREVILDSADIWNLSTANHVIVPSKAFHFHSIDKVFFYSTGGDDYDFAGSVSICINGNQADSLITGVEHILNNYANLWVGTSVYENMYPHFQLFGQDFSLTASSVPTVGNKGLKVIVYYYEF